jgi:hypothetical protein
MFILFFLVGSSILGGIHYYLYFRLVRDPQLPDPWRRRIRIGLVALLVCIPLSFGLIRVLDNGLSVYAVFPVYVWLGVLVIFFFTILPVDAVRGLVWIGRRVRQGAHPEVDPERRQWFARVVAGSVTGATVTAAVAGTWHGLGTLVVKRVEVTLPRLPRAFDGFTIAQLTDLHVGPMRHRPWVEQVVTMTNAIGPELVAITGDLVDGSVAQLAEDVAPLAGLTAPHGRFFVTGNHEYFVDVKGWLEHLRSALGLRVLRNERVAIHKGGAAIDLAGVDDPAGARFMPGHGPDVERAMKGRDPRRVSVLLAHQPRTVDDAARHKVDLQLSGHTHGGQILLWRYLVYLQQPYVSGLHLHRRTQTQQTQIYVSHGTGFWGPPMRLGSTAEITKVVLRAG